MNFEGYRKYVFVLIITSVIFFTAFSISNYSNEKRIQNIQSIEDKIALDLLSSETQFNLLKELSCKTIDNSVLSQELNSIVEKLAYAEENLGTTDPEVIRLKNTLPAIIIGDETHYGFKSREKIEKLMPVLAKLKAEREKAQNTATST